MTGAEDFFAYYSKILLFCKRVDIRRLMLDAKIMLAIDIRSYHWFTFNIML